MKEELTLKSVADQLHINAVYLGQVFKKEIRYSFSQYLNQIRIKRAQYLLLNSNFNINEISEEIGYNNTNYFSIYVYLFFYLQVKKYILNYI